MGIETWHIEPGVKVQLYSPSGFKVKIVEVEEGPWDTFDSFLWFKYDGNKAAFFSEKNKRWQMGRD